MADSSAMDSLTAVEPIKPSDGSPGVKSLGLPIMAAGLATTALALFAVYYLGERSEIYVMGWYANFVIPVGALLVGALAGCGYGVASWVTGTKIRRSLMWNIVVTQIAAYGFAQYQEYKILVDQDPLLAQLSFTEYFDLTTRAFAWEEDGEAGEPFGVWGYAMRAIEVAGFTLGGLIAPALLMAAPYCESCGVYMKTKQLGILPAGIKPRKIKKKDKEGQAAYEKEIQDALDTGGKLVEKLREMYSEGDSAGVREVIAEHKANQKEIGKQTTRTQVSIHRCPRCNGGTLKFDLVSGQGDKVEILATEEWPVSSEFATGLIA